MTEQQLSRLIDQPLREAWPHEAHAFTHWLAENIDTLAGLIGMPLEVIGREVRVEEFQADLLLRNPEDDTRVLVENQLERADHMHLGQILTYLAGLDVRIVVWIAAEFREAHLSALKWLNDHTSDDFGFFAVRLRVVRIADSPLAPILEVMAKPNEWERQLHAAAPRAAESETAVFRRAFWQQYLDLCPEDAELGVKATGASSVWLPVDPEGQLVVSLWVSNEHVGLFVRGPRGAVGGGLIERVAPFNDEIARRLGSTDDIDRLGYRWIKRRPFAPGDERSRVEAIEWLHEEAVRYLAVFTEFLREP